MRATYRPAFTVRRSDLPEGSPARSHTGPEALRVPALDEDEATMAVAVAHALLDARASDALAGLQVVLSSHTRTGWGPTFAEALGLPPECVREGSSDEVASLVEADLKPSRAGSGFRLAILSDASRPGSRPLETEGIDSKAIGALTSPHLAASADLEVGPPATILAADAYQRLSKWEREAPLQVPRGAYIPESTWNQARPARYRLLAGRCSRGHTRYPPRPVCPDCGAPAELAPLSRRGTLETFTVIAKGGGPAEFDALQETQGDYAVGIARFDRTPVPGMICDTPPEGLRIGLAVEPVFRRLFAQDGAWRYGLKFRGADSAPTPTIRERQKT